MCHARPTYYSSSTSRPLARRRDAVSSFKETRRMMKLRQGYMYHGDLRACTTRKRSSGYLLAAFSIAATACAELVAIKSQGTNHVCSPSTADGAVDGPFRQRSR